MDLLERENLNDLFEKFMRGGRDVYSLMIEKTGNFSDTDRKELDNFLKMCDNNRSLFNDICAPSDVLPKQEEFSHIISKNYKIGDVKHRLYFNFDMLDRLKFVERYMSLCIEHSEPFYVKILKENNRKDNTLIYLSDEQLPKFREMLSAIEKEMPWLKDNQDLPLAVEGCGWFGYGEERNDKSNHSFNGRVAMAVTQGFAQTLNAYRYLISVESSLAEFGRGLYEVCKARHGQNIYLQTHDMKLYNEYMSSDNDGLKDAFVGRSMRMALDFFGDKGFAGTQNGGCDCLKDNLALLDIADSQSGEKLSVTPMDVLSIIADGRHCKLNFQNEQERVEFMNALDSNVLSNVIVEGLLDVRVPEILKDNAMEM